MLILGASEAEKFSLSWWPKYCETPCILGTTVDTFSMSASGPVIRKWRKVQGVPGICNPGTHKKEESSSEDSDSDNSEEKALLKTT